MKAKLEIPFFDSILLASFSNVNYILLYICMSGPFLSKTESPPVSLPLKSWAAQYITAN